MWGKCSRHPWRRRLRSDDQPKLSQEGLHVPRERLSKETLALHQAIVSLIEDLEAGGRYRIWICDCEDGEMKEIRHHSMRGEIAHAMMVSEWNRRLDAGFEKKNQAMESRVAPIGH